MARATDADAFRRRPWWRPHPLTVLVALAGVLLTTGLTWGAARIHDRNEDRLLAQRTREGASIISANLATLQTPLRSLADLAEATNGEDDILRRALSALLVREERYVAATVWLADGSLLTPLVAVGDPTALSRRPPGEVSALLAEAAHTEFAAYDLTDEAVPSLGYSVVSDDDVSRYVVYVERNLPADRLHTVRPQDAFSGIDTATYFGPTESRDALLTTTSPELPLRGRRHVIDLPLGDDGVMRLVAVARADLGGQLMGRLWWLLLTVGLGVTVLGTWMVERLHRRRDEAADLATENRRLYSEQRTVARTLQDSLLPRIAPEVGELAFASYYTPAATEDADIGGDWYDAVEVDGGDVVFTVGDVSGRGLHAATIMASMRYAMRAYAVEGLPPERILRQLCSLLDLHADGHFATVVCGRVDVDRGVVHLANAGHPRPLLVDREGARFLEVGIGPPIGVTRDHAYEATTVPFPRGATIVAFTDGLFERRNETIDTGLERLRAAASGSADRSPSNVLDSIRQRLGDGAAGDDTAMLGVTWNS